MGDAIDDELEAVVRRVREIRRRNLLARVAGASIGLVTLIGAAVLYHLTGIRLIAYGVVGVGVVVAGMVWRAIESKVHVDEL